jgi:hypothetical protein
VLENVIVGGAKKTKTRYIVENKKKTKDSVIPKGRGGVYNILVLTPWMYCTKLLIYVFI